MFTDGDVFQEQRRFTLRNLRDLGFGKTCMESTIHDEINELIDEIDSKANTDTGNVVDFRNMFNLSLINVMWAVVGGERFRRTDVRLQRLLDMVDGYSRNFRPITATLPIPAWLLRCLPASTRRSIGLANDMLSPLQDFIRVSYKQLNKEKFRFYLCSVDDDRRAREISPGKLSTRLYRCLLGRDATDRRGIFFSR